MRLSLLAGSFAVLFLLACHDSSQRVYEGISTLNSCQRDSFVSIVDASDFVFIGNVVSLDGGWYPSSGIGASYEKVTCNIIQVLKGQAQAGKIVLIKPILGNSLDERIDLRKGLFSLDPDYYNHNVDFIFLVQNQKSLSLNRAWQATSDNISEVNKQLRNERQVQR